MTKVNREIVVSEALDLLDEVGLDAVSTRRLAKRLGVEQPSLYWYFRTKKDLLAAMAEAAMVPHATAPLPTPGDDWRDWFADNTRSFRRTLLMRRDGARLHSRQHACRRPRPDPPQDGVPRRLRRARAGRADGHAGRFYRFTVGSVLEEQADTDPGDSADLPADMPVIDHESAFEAGLTLILNGLAYRTSPGRSESTGPVPGAL